MNKTKVNLGVIQETLLISLWARAFELQAVDPIIVDPKSSEILAAIDYEFDKFTTANFYQIGCCLRGTILDNWVRNLNTPRQNLIGVSQIFIRLKTGIRVTKL